MLTHAEKRFAATHNYVAVSSHLQDTRWCVHRLIHGRCLGQDCACHEEKETGYVRDVLFRNAVLFRDITERRYVLLALYSTWTFEALEGPLDTWCHTQRVVMRQIYPANKEFIGMVAVEIVGLPKEEK
jgi:hypothetical protein